MMAAGNFERCICIEMCIYRPNDKVNNARCRRSHTAAPQIADAEAEVFEMNFLFDRSIATLNGSPHPFITIWIDIANA